MKNIAYFEIHDALNEYVFSFQFKTFCVWHSSTHIQLNANRPNNVFVYVILYITMYLKNRHADALTNKKYLKNRHILI